MYLLGGLWIILRIWPGQVIVCSSYPCSSLCPGTVTGTTGPTSWLITPWHGSWPVSAHLVRGVVRSPLALSCLYHHVCFIQWVGKAPRGNSILDLQSDTLPLCHQGTHLWLLQVFNSGVRGICGRIFIWTVFIWTVDYFCPDWYLNRGPLDLQSDTLPLCHRGTHLWLLQVFNSGVRGICGRIFIWTVDYFCPDQYLNRGPLDLQSDTLPLCHWGTHLWLLQVFNSGVRGICGRIFIWTVDYFCPDRYLNRGPLDLQIDTLPLCHRGTHLWLLQVFNSGVRGICGRIFIWTVDYFCPDRYLNRGPLDLQSDTLPLCHWGTHLWLLQVFNSGVRGICGRIFNWTVDYFCPDQYLNRGPLDLQSDTLPLCHRGTHLWLLQVFNSGVRGICGRIFIWTVDYFCPDRYLNRGPLDLQSDTLPLCHWGWHSGRHIIIIIIIIIIISITWERNKIGKFSTFVLVQT